MKITRSRMLGALAATVVAGSLVGTWLGTPGSEPRTEADGVVIADADDVSPSVTNTDWVTYADQVVVVRPVAEKEIPPSADEREAGEGYIGRSATLSVDQVLWSRAGAPTAPASVTLDVAGWTFQGDQRRKFAVHDSPRLEKGHTYIVALARLQDGTWSALGSSAVLPYDNETIGKGESEGTIHTPPAPGPQSAEALAAPDADNSVESLTSGRTADALVSVLKAAKPASAPAPESAPESAPAPAKN
ncbi:hypothetical protein [Streptomyces sp. SYSU K21746]